MTSISANNPWFGQYEHAQKLARSGQGEEARLFGLSVLEHLEGGAGTFEDILVWRGFLESVTPQWRADERKTRPPPVPVIYHSAVLRITTDARGFLILVNPSLRQVLRMVRWRLMTDVEVRPSENVLWLMGALQSAVWNSSTDNSSRIGVEVPEGSNVAAAAAGIRRGLRLPVVAVKVGEDELRRNPGAYNGMLVECEGEWVRGFECSQFAGLWLTAPGGHGGVGEYQKRGRVKVVGWVGYSGELGFGRGYGHLGMSKGGIEAVRVEEVG